MKATRRIRVWICDECDYWRADKATGVHQTTNPEDPTGKMIRHSLREVEFVEAKA